MSLKRTNIYLDDRANKDLQRIGKRLGLAPAQLTDWTATLAARKAALATF
jgi:hypothetical protein